MSASRLAILLVFLFFACSDSSEPSSDSGARPLVDSYVDSDATEAPLPPEVPDDAPLVIFLGDSISAGLHLAAHEAFPAVLQRKLSSEGTLFRLVNAGLSGDTTAGGLRRLDWMLKQDPDVLVVELGANDGLRGVPLSDIEKNLRAIIERTRAEGVRVLLLGMRLPPNYGEEYTEGFAALYEQLASELEVDCVPFFMNGVAGRPELNFEDGIHPIAAGQELLAANVAPHLARILVELN